MNNFVVGICRNPTNWARRRRRRESKVRKREEKQRPSERERGDGERERERERLRVATYMPSTEARKRTNRDRQEGR